MRKCENAKKWRRERGGVVERGSCVAGGGSHGRDEGHMVVRRLHTPHLPSAYLSTTRDTPRALPSWPTL
eukprot:4291777-Prymnesium_polylepis.1